MHPIAKAIEEFQRQLKQGSIQEAYRALLSYMMRLRKLLEDRFTGTTVSALYQGHMDITYFALFPSAFKDRDLKIAMVFNYDAFAFEAWLAARNRKVQRQYWEWFKDGQWPKYRLSAPAKGVFSILECDLARGVDLGNPRALTASIEKGLAAFIGDIERFLWPA